MKAECVECGESPNDENWAEYDYINGDFYCPSCTPSNNKENFGSGECELCERTDIKTSTHHLVPQSQDGGDEEENLADLCESCHRKVHATYSNKELAERLNTIPKLSREQEMRSYVAWIRKTDKRNVVFKQSSRAKYL